MVKRTTLGYLTLSGFCGMCKLDWSSPYLGSLPAACLLGLDLKLTSNSYHQKGSTAWYESNPNMKHMLGYGFKINTAWKGRFWSCGESSAIDHAGVLVLVPLRTSCAALGRAHGEYSQNPPKCCAKRCYNWAFPQFYFLAKVLFQLKESGNLGHPTNAHLIGVWASEFK